MVRMVIGLDPEDKAWPDRKSRETGSSMTALVREAISCYRAEDGKRRTSSLNDLLEKTGGSWKRGDALSWQKKIRDAWSR